MSLIIFLAKSKDLRILNKKLIAIYLLNVTDIIFTLLLLSTGEFIEGNMIMAHIINRNPIWGLLIKIVIPLILTICISSRMRNASEEQLSKSNIIITVALAIYTLINLSHIIWTALYMVV